MASLLTLPNGHLALPSDEVSYLPLIDHDNDGNVVAMPVGDVQSVAPTGTFAASVTTVIANVPNSNPPIPAIAVTPLVKQSDAGNGGGSIGIALTDTAGLVMDAALAAALFDIVVDTTPKTMGVDFTGVVSVSQPEPAAPGP